MSNKEQIIVAQVLRWVVACNFMYEKKPTRLNDLIGSLIFLITMPILLMRILFFLAVGK